MVIVVAGVVIAVYGVTVISITEIRYQLLYNIVLLSQIVHRNRQPHSGTMFTKTSESTASKGRAIVLASNYDVDDNELEKLRTENDQLKTSLDQVINNR